MYKKFRFIENGLAGDLFYPDPSRKITAKSAGLYLFGLPSFIGQNEVTYALTANGVISCQPHYLGTFDSEGQFSPQSVIETCIKVQEIFDSGSVFVAIP